MTDERTPVSYTHLDVYKRQAHIFVGPEFYGAAGKGFDQRFVDQLF
ncbi:hypothetical protein [Erwinia amylovora]